VRLQWHAAGNSSRQARRWVQRPGLRRARTQRTAKRARAARGASRRVGSAPQARARAS